MRKKAKDYKKKKEEKNIKSVGQRGKKDIIRGWKMDKSWLGAKRLKSRLCRTTIKNNLEYKFKIKEFKL